jgi:hypothetical protein
MMHGVRLKVYAADDMNIEEYRFDNNNGFEGGGASPPIPC